MNETVLIFLLVICACAAVLVGISIIDDIIFYKKSDKDDIEDDMLYLSDTDSTKDIKILLKPDAISTIDKVLDQCIKDAGDIYNIMILAPAQLTSGSNNYINEAEQNKMTQYIIQSVHTRMSDSMVKLLSLSYKIETKDDLDKIIELRVKLYMLNFIMNYNGLK